MNLERWFNWTLDWFFGSGLWVLTRYWFYVIPSSINREYKHTIDNFREQEHLCSILTLQLLPLYPEIYYCLVSYI